MEVIKNMKISQKLMLLIIISAVFILVIGSIGFYSINKANKSIATLYTDRLVPVSQLSKMSINSNAVNANLLAMLLSDTMQKKINYNNEMKKWAGENNELLKSYKSKKMTKEEEEIIP